MRASEHDQVGAERPQRAWLSGVGFAFAWGIAVSLAHPGREASKEA